MPHISRLVVVSIISLAATAQAQCVTDGFVPCLPAGSQLGGVPSGSLDDSGFWDNLQSITSLPIGRRDLSKPLIARQDALCCAPDVECLVTTDEDIPFCYNPQTTRYVFSDESFGFLSNGTYYAADGTFVDFQDGTYSSTDGSTGTFAPATAAATSATAMPSTAVVATTANPVNTQKTTQTTRTPAAAQPVTTPTKVAGSGAVALKALGASYFISAIMGLLLAFFASLTFL